LDLAPREVDADPERLADRLLPGEAGGVVLRRVRPRLAVLALRLREAARPEARVALERPPDALDLDQIDADPHATRPSHAGKSAIELTTTSGTTSIRSRADGRNFPVRTSAVRIPQR